MPYIIHCRPVYRIVSFRFSFSVIAITHQGSDHDNTDGQSIPQSAEANVSIDPAHGCTKRLTCLAIGIELTDHNISWVRHHGTQNTSHVSTRERNCCLSTLVVVGLVSRQAMVDHFDDCFKRGELHHGVGDLAAPEWVQTLVQAGWTPISTLDLNFILTVICGWTYPDTPSLETTEEIPLKVPLRSGGMVVCMRTLTASKGHRATSAMNSAEALAVR